MKYYHGSRSRFKEFTIKGNGQHGEGFYFTADYLEACAFARQLTGNGQDFEYTLYTVNLSILNSFDSMSIDHCNLVMNFIGQKYRPNKNAGGAKEHYYFLCRQLKSNGFDNPNEIIKNAGFDSIRYNFMNHVIVFDNSKIEIEEIEHLD